MLPFPNLCWSYFDTCLDSHGDIIIVGGSCIRRKIVYRCACAVSHNYLLFLSAFCSLLFPGCFTLTHGSGEDMFETQIISINETVVDKHKRCPVKCRSSRQLKALTVIPDHMPPLVTLHIKTPRSEQNMFFYICMRTAREAQKFTHSHTTCLDETLWPPSATSRPTRRWVRRRGVGARRRRDGVFLVSLG